MMKAIMSPKVPCRSQLGMIIKTQRKKKQNVSECIASRTLKVNIRSNLSIFSIEVNHYTCWEATF